MVAPKDLQICLLILSGFSFSFFLFSSPQLVGVKFRQPMIIMRWFCLLCVCVIARTRPGYKLAVLNTPEITHVCLFVDDHS